MELHSNLCQNFISSEAVCKTQEVFYFEIKLKRATAKRQIVVGFAQNEVSQSQQLGQLKNQFGMRADGKLFCVDQLSILNQEVFEGFTQSDIVGCGLLLSKKEIFYTVNGKYLGVCFKNVDLGLTNNLAESFPYL